MRRILSGISRTFYVAVLTVAWFAPGVAQAASYTVSAESDFYFTVTDQTSTIIYGNSNAGCSNFSTDPYLWLYDSTGALVAQNDDGNHNATDQCVSAKIATTLAAGDYRLRTGYCCSQQGLGANPYNGATYELVLDFTAWDQPGITTTVMPTTTTVVTTTSTSTTSTSTTTAPSTSITTSTSTTSTSSTTTTSTSTTSTSTTSSTTTPNTTTTSPPSSPTTVAVSSTTSTTTVPVVEPPLIPAPSGQTVTPETSPPQTTTPATTTTTTPPTTSTTVTTTTVPPTTTTQAPTTTVVPTTTILATTSTAPATTTTRPPTTTTPETTVRASTTTLAVSPSTTVKPPPTTDAPTLAPEQIAAIDDPVVADAVTQIVTDPENLTVEEAQSIFEAIDTLEPDTLAVVVDALSEAPPDIKAEFEESVNIYDGDFDAYVPSGSNVTVAQRRTIVVVTAATASPLSPLAPASVRRRR